MREFKFRALTYENNMIYHVGSIEFFTDGTIIVNGELAVKELMQWTGLKDRSSVDIYEGDIIVKDRYPFFYEGKRNYVGVVEWIFASWQYVIQCVNPEKRGLSSGVNMLLDDDGEEGKHFEVIGNVHQNPELLE